MTRLNITPGRLAALVRWLVEHLRRRPAAIWAGATEDWSPTQELRALPPADMDDTASLLEAARALHEQLDLVEADLRTELDVWWATVLVRLRVDVDDMLGSTWDEAMAAAGVLALAAAPAEVDEPTGELVAA